MDIVFLGTGGGRINLIKQIRGTGGFRINSETANIHVDPGPGALIASKKFRQDPLKLDCIIVTHSHTDHITDAQVMIEGMSGYALRRRGIFIGSRRSVAELSEWHKGKIDNLVVLAPGEKKGFDTEKGHFDIEAYPVKHDEETAFGFKIKMDGVVLGHITDSELTKNLGKDFSGCDCLIINCIKPEPDQYAGHLTSDDVIEILKVAKPKQAIITHMGLKMLRFGPASEAKRIADATGVKVIAAKDGMKITL